MKSLKVTFLTFIFLSSMSVANATEYTHIDATKSKITFSSKLMGSTISGTFKKFNGKVNFDSSNPSKSKAEIVIDIGSFQAGGDELREEAQGKPWFNTATYPEAKFISQEVKETGKGKLQLIGKLTIKNKTQSINIPATYVEQAGQVAFETVFQIKRLDFSLGEGNWADTSTVANEVPVKVQLVITQK
jgi:polyisoprenoid-binding protein YceI